MKISLRKSVVYTAAIEWFPCVVCIVVTTTSWLYVLGPMAHNPLSSEKIFPGFMFWASWLIIHFPVKNNFLAMSMDLRIHIFLQSLYSREKYYHGQVYGPHSSGYACTMYMQSLYCSEKYYHGYWIQVWSEGGGRSPPFPSCTRLVEGDVY